MKKTTLTVLWLILCLNTALSQNPVITIITAKTINDPFTFYLKTNIDTKVNVDFGNGIKQEFQIRQNDLTKITGNLARSTVTVYGDDSKITYFRCEKQALKSLDITKNKKLSYLNCAENQLETLDVSTNIDLEELDCSKNKLASLHVVFNED